MLSRMARYIFLPTVLIHRHRVAYLFLQLDPLKDDFLHASGTSSVAIRRLEPFGHPSPLSLYRENQVGIATERELQREPSASVEMTDEEENSEEDRRTTPTDKSPFSLEEKTLLLGPPSPPPPLFMPETIRTLARSTVVPLNAVSNAMWKRAFKSCVLVAKVSSCVLVMIPVIMC